MVFPDLIWILLVLLCSDAYFWRSAHIRLRTFFPTSLWRTLIGAFMSLQIFYLLVALLLPWQIRKSSSPIPIAYHTEAYIWHMMALPVIGIIFAIRLARTRRSRLRTQATQPGEIKPKPHSLTSAPLPVEAHSPSPIPRAPSRRQVLAAAAVVAAPPLASLAVAAGTLVQLPDLRVRRFELRLPTLPPAFDGMTITQVSDLHIGRFLHADRLPAIVQTVNALGSDFLVFTGDLIDLSLEDLPIGIDFLRSLKSRNGMAICEGNHDLAENRGYFERRMLEEGLPLLINQGMTVPFRGRQLQFLGLPWNGFDEAHEQAMQYLRPQIDPDAFPILLAHHPHAFDAAAAAHIPLTLSGHTHGGQIMINERLGAGNIRFRYISGFYEKAASSLLVCNGIGNWFPLRINAPAELLHITLRK